MKKKEHRLLLGAHMSIAGGLEQAILRGESIDCTTIQIFTKSNRQWRAKPITEKAITLFKNTQDQSIINPVIAHASYLLNLGTPDRTLMKKSVTSTKEELERCEHLGIPYLVMHVGAYLKSNEQICLQRISDNLNEIFHAIPGKTMILIENTAGQGSNVCYSFEQIALLRRQSSFKKRLGVCFDTCHAFAAGYDFRTPKNYRQMWRKFDTLIGLPHLKVIHTNDSKNNLGSRIDRHEEIGKGKLGLEAFRLLVNDPRFFDIPKILETPKKTLQDYARQMRLLKSLILKKNYKKLKINE